MTPRLRRLADRLRVAQRRGNLRVDTSLFDTPLWGPFPNRAVVLSSMQLRPAARSLTLTGDLQELRPPGLTQLAIRSVEVTVRFTDRSRAIDVSIDLRGKISVGSRTIWINGEADQDAIRFNLGAPVERLRLEPLLSLVSNGAVSLPVLGLLRSVTVTTLALSFAFDDERDTEIRVGASPNRAWTVVPDVLEVADTEARIDLSYLRRRNGRSLFYTARLVGTATVGLPFQMDVPLVARRDLDLTFGPASDAVSPTLLDAAGLLGGDAMRTRMETALAAMKLGSPTLDSVTLSFDTERRRPRLAVARGRIELAGMECHLEAHIPFRASGELRFLAESGRDASVPVDELTRDLVGRYDALALPPVLRSTVVRNLAVSAHSGSRSLSFGFDTELLLAGRTRLDARIHVAIGTSPDGFEKTFEGYIRLSGLHFAIDFSTAPSRTAFSASFDNRQNSPANIGLDGYETPVPARGTLFGLLRAIVSDGPLSDVPDVFKESLDRVTLTSNRIQFGTLAAVSYQRGDVPLAADLGRARRLLPCRAYQATCEASGL